MRKIAAKAISLLCVFSMLFSTLITVKASQTSEIKLTAGSLTVTKGVGTESVELPIAISNNTGIIGMTLTVNYGEGLTLTGIKKGDAFTSLTMTKTGNLSANPVKVTWDGEESNDYGNGTAVTLSFDVPKDVEKEYPIEISVEGAIDENISKVNITTENGKITVGGSSHSHSYGAWEKVDDTNHKKTCECGDTVTEAHSWNSGVVTTPATHTTAGVRTFTCSVCKATKTEAIAADVNNHTFGEWEKVDENNHSHKCACGKTETKVHNWNDGEITTPATYTTTGLKTFTCAMCGAVKTETLAMLTRSRGGGGVSSYTVKFNTNGGSEFKNISVKRGQTIGTITAPTKNGYVFTGWYSDKELTKQYDDDAKVTAATTLYAGWKVDPVRQLILTVGKKDAAAFGQSKSNDVAPKIVNDRTMLPARFVAENLGAKVEWNGEKELVTITGKNLQTGEDVTILITINSEIANVNGKDVKLDSPAFVENDRTYTPVRFISEELGTSVEWDENAQQVIITKALAVEEK